MTGSTVSLCWILSLCYCLSAAVKVNETRSDFFAITNGTRQGCPLLSLIFILTLEPFLCTVRLDPSVAGLRKASGVHKVDAFADDLNFFLTDPLMSLPNLLHSFWEYGTLSYFQINLSKSSALNITVEQDVIGRLCPSFPFH